MEFVAAQPVDQTIPLVLGSIVERGGQHGVVWHATDDTLRVLRIERGLTSPRLPLASELALHLPLSLSGWGIACDDLVAWPRALCRVVGELDDRCLLKVLDARRQTVSLASAAIADSVLSAAIHHRDAVAALT